MALRVLEAALTAVWCTTGVLDTVKIVNLRRTPPYGLGIKITEHAEPGCVRNTAPTALVVLSFLNPPTHMHVEDLMPPAGVCG